MKKTNVNQRSNKLFNNPYQQLFPLYGNTFLSKDFPKQDDKHDNPA